MGIERIIDRFDKYMKFKNLSDNQVTVQVSLSVGLLGKSRKEGRDLSRAVVNNLLLFYTDLNRVWLLTGEGSMIKQDDTQEIKTEDLTTQKTNGVPYFDIDISASITESFNDVREKPEFYVDFKYFNDCTAYLPIWGDSMYPAYASGEIIAVKRINNPDIIQWGEAYLVITSAEANNMKTVKLLFPHEESDKIILRASNPNFKGDTVIPKSSILSLYIVKGKITRKQL